MKLAPILWSLAVLAWTTCAQAGLEITEFSANSNGSFPDVDGEASDWIELQNTGNIPVSTSGYSLTDENDELSKWPLPAITLGPGEFLIVFATGNDRRDPGQQLHANFSLRASSGYLALVEPGELTVATEFDYPKQFYGLSYGAGGYFSNPTPGAPNLSLIHI